jgi:hypothetical protein
MSGNSSGPGKFDNNNMDERKLIILKAIIEDYVTSAEPVGSRTIAKKVKWVSVRQPFEMKWLI